MRDNLEHGWLLRAEKEDYKGEIVGYCECCDEPIYEYENYDKVDGVLICQNCVEAKYEREERELEEEFEGE